MTFIDGPLKLIVEFGHVLMAQRPLQADHRAVTLPAAALLESSSRTSSRVRISGTAILGSISHAVKFPFSSR